MRNARLERTRRAYADDTAAERLVRALEHAGFAADADPALVITTLRNIVGERESELLALRAPRITTRYDTLYGMNPVT